MTPRPAALVQCDKHRPEDDVPAFVGHIHRRL